MKRKKPYIRLTNSEFAMMQLLWEAGRPLNRAEIMEIALRDPENPLFAKNSFHVIINNLIGYQFIAAFINDGPGRKNARRFAPLLTRNEYAGLQIATTEHYKASDIPEIVAAIFKYTKDADKEELLPKIEEAVRRCKYTENNMRYEDGRGCSVVFLFYKKFDRKAPEYTELYNYMQI